MLRRSQVGAEVSGGVDFETEAVPGVEGYGCVETVQRVVRAWDAVEGIGKEAIAAVNLKLRWGLGAVWAWSAGKRQRSAMSEKRRDGI